jgi:hypothetical protein
MKKKLTLVSHMDMRGDKLRGYEKSHTLSLWLLKHRIRNNGMQSRETMMMMLVIRTHWCLQ